MTLKVDQGLVAGIYQKMVIKKRPFNGPFDRVGSVKAFDGLIFHEGQKIRTLWIPHEVLLRQDSSQNGRTDVRFISEKPINRKISEQI
jgi:hypothetical protein